MHTHRLLALIALGMILPPLAWAQTSVQPPLGKKDDRGSPSATKSPEKPGSDLTGYKTVKEAIPADPKQFRGEAVPVPAVPAFVGIELSRDKAALIEDVAVESPAAEAGLKAGDVIVKLAGVAVATPLDAREKLRAAAPGEKLALVVKRQGKEMALSVTPRPASKPFSPSGSGPGNRALLGIQLGSERKNGGVLLDAVTSGGAADKAGLKSGDVLLQIDEARIMDSDSVREYLTNKKPGDIVKLLFLRDGKESEVRATLQGEAPAAPMGRPGGSLGWDDRLPNIWRKTSYNLAVIGVEYPDVKHNEKIKGSDWEESLFSLGTYKDKSATGGSVYGSMNDYYKEISYGSFKVEGKFLGWYEVSKKRAEYSTGSGTSGREKVSYFNEVLEKVTAKDKDALKGYDGVFFLYAGGRVQTTRGGLYWPHRSSVTFGGKRWPYFIVQEGGNRMTNISVFCHEFGHMLGLPDLYARPEEPGMEGVGVCCAMSQQINNGRPQHFSAWCKEQLGWIRPTVIDPRVKQKLILAPIEDSPGECLKVMVKPDGSEYFLLENRRQKGFDKDLPAEGLLIWRVTPGNRTQAVFLEESHGVPGPSGPRMYAGAVPYPSPANNAFTPFTTPSSKSVTGGGLDVYITNIRRLPDGRVTLQIGYEYQ